MWALKTLWFVLLLYIKTIKKASVCVIFYYGVDEAGLYYSGGLTIYFLKTP